MKDNWSRELEWESSSISWEIFIFSSVFTVLSKELEENYITQNAFNSINICLVYRLLLSIFFSLRLTQSVLRDEDEGMQETFACALWLCFWYDQSGLCQVSRGKSLAKMKETWKVFESITVMQRIQEHNTAEYKRNSRFFVVFFVNP